MISGEQNQDFRILKKIIGDLEYKRALDLGCGYGLYTKILKNSVSIDISIDALKLAKKYSKNLVLADARKLPFKDNSFDFIVSIEVITHIDRRFWKEVFSETDRVLKKNGIVIISLHNKNRYKKEITEAGYKIFWAEENEITKYLKNYRIEKILYVNLLPQKFQSYEFYTKHNTLYKILSIIEDLLVKFPVIKKYSLQFIIIARKVKKWK